MEAEGYTEGLGDWSRIEKESFFLIALAQYIDPYMKMHP